MQIALMRSQSVETSELSPKLLHKMDAYWRAANYLSVGQIYLFDNPLLKRPLALADVKHMLLGHWGTTPGQNFIYVHLNRVIKKYDLDMIYVSGPGHGGPAVVGNTYLEGTYSEIYPNISQDEAGLQKLFLQFSFPGGIPSHASPECPGSIHEGGELGYSLSHSFGAVFDNPDLIVACVVGDGEAETGPLATAWHSNKFLDPATDGAVLPILHLNGYKISNPTVLARIEREELEQLLRGYGWTPYFVEGHEPGPMHEAMAATLDMAVEQIKQIQQNARLHGDLTRPRWPMIVLNSPKGWTGPKIVDGLQVEGTFRAHQVPLHPAAHPEHLKLLEDWLRSYRPEELFDDEGRLKPELAELAPQGERRMGANPARQRRHAAPRLADARFPRLRRGRAGARRARHRRCACARAFPARRGKAEQRAAEFPSIWPRRDTFQWPGIAFRSHESPMGRRDCAERRVSRVRRTRAGLDAQRAPMRGLARRLSAHRAARDLQLLRGVHPHHRFDVQPARQVAESHVGLAMAAEDRLAELPAGIACLASGSQWLHTPRSRFHRPRREQEGRGRACLPSAGCQLPAVGHGPLPPQPALRQRRDCGQTPGSAMADDGRSPKALHRGHRHLAVGQQRPGRGARRGHGLLWRRAHAGNARRRLDHARASTQLENPRGQCRRPDATAAAIRAPTRAERHRISTSSSPRTSRSSSPSMPTRG